MPTQRPMAAAVLAGAVLALGLSSAATASAAAPAQAVRTVPSGTYTVTPRTEAPVQSGTGPSFPVRGVLHPGRTYFADCWILGGTVSDHGQASGVWIHVLGDRDFGDGFVNAVYLYGDPYAGLPADAHC